MSDIGVFRLSGGYWYLHESTSGNSSIQWGQTGDVPVAGDYDGDGEADVGVWRPGDTTWYLNQSTEEYSIYPFGDASDIPVPGDYDGDGRMDAAVWRPSTGVWHLRQSSNGYRAKQFGASTDIPIPSYVLYRSAEGRSALRRGESLPPPVDPSDKRWRAPGIPAKDFVRQTFKPGTVAGLADPETVRKVLGERAMKRARQP